eukprot:11177299-Lingulodinium_polyedra.AAC.1
MTQRRFNFTVAQLMFTTVQQYARICAAPPQKCPAARRGQTTRAPIPWRAYGARVSRRRARTRRRNALLTVPP